MGKVYQLIKANRAQFPARVLCETLGVSHSGYYDWAKRTPSRRAITNCRLIEQIMAIYRTSDCTYGRPRITVELADRGVKVNHKRVGRLMREAGIKGVSRRRSFVITTHRNKRDRPAPDLVQRHFKAASINQLWVADMTYIPTWAGFLYLAVVIDVFSRKVVGWSFVSLQPHHLPTFFQQCFNSLWCERQQFIDPAVRPGGEFIEGVG